MNEKVTKSAYIEAQILFRAGTQNLLAPAVQLVEAEYGLQKGSLGNGVFTETRILSLLYTLIVVPKEFWSLDKDHPVYGQINKSWPLTKVNIIKDQSHFADPVYKFVHHLRNAIAHAHFEFKDDDFEFWDQRKNKPEAYRAKLPMKEMLRFLDIVGALFANLKHDNKA